MDVGEKCLNNHLKEIFLYRHLCSIIGVYIANEVSVWCCYVYVNLIEIQNLVGDGKG